MVSAVTDLMNTVLIVSQARRFGTHKSPPKEGLHPRRTRQGDPLVLR